MRVFKDFKCVSSKEKLFQKMLIWKQLGCERGKDRHGKEQVQAWNGTQDLSSAESVSARPAPHGCQSPSPSSDPTWMVLEPLSQP